MRIKIKNEYLAIVLTILGTVVTVIGVLGFEHYRRSEYTVELIARATEHGSWYPSTIKLAYGKPAKILIRNVDVVSHGFALPEFEIAVFEIKAGETAVIEFTPNKRGTFMFLCTIWCSNRHMEMRGQLIVE
jgi:heme/copper-type cytochrome/quinol oxidase subunit 2